MPPTREAALVALLTKLTGAASFYAVTRNLIAPEQMCVPGSPGLALRLRGDRYHRPNINQPPRRDLIALAIVYVAGVAGNPNLIWETLLNDTVDAIDAALAPDNPATGLCTLGGVVYYAGRLTEVEAPVFEFKTGYVGQVLPLQIILP